MNMRDVIQALDNLPDAENLWHEAVGKERFAFKKSLGQNFIFDKNLNEKITSFTDLKNAKCVLEIGAGAGTLTRAILYGLLLNESDAKLFVIEPDERCLACLQPLKDVVGDRLQIMQGFAEKQDFAGLLPDKACVIANLPYNVSSNILLKLLDTIQLFSSLTLMFQAEVAMRICAEPNSKDYGRLSVAVQFLCNARNVMTLPPQAFTPSPQVDSAVVQLTPLGDKVERQASWQALQEITRMAFSTRRKMLRNTLQAIDNLPDLLASAGIDGMRRAETLSVEEFDRLAACYEKR